MKKALSKFVGITLLCAAIIGGGALISHLALNKSENQNVKENSTSTSTTQRLESAKHEFLSGKYDFRNSVQSAKKYNNTSDADYNSLSKFINDSNTNESDSDISNKISIGSLRVANTYIDEDSQEEVSVYEWGNVYKGNGGLRIGVNNSEDPSYIIFPLNYTDNEFSISTVKLHVSSYNTVINNVDHYDSVSASINNKPFNITGESIIEADAESTLNINVSSGRLIIYQIDFYSDYFKSFSVGSMDNVPEDGYSYSDCGSFLWRELWAYNKFLLLNNHTGRIELITSFEYFDQGFDSTDDYEILIECSDGQFFLSESVIDYSYVIVLRNYNFLLTANDIYEVEGEICLPSGLFMDESSEFMVFKRSNSLNPSGIQY